MSTGAIDAQAFLDRFEESRVLVSPIVSPAFGRLLVPRCRMRGRAALFYNFTDDRFSQADLSSDKSCVHSRDAALSGRG
jgi:hypothetical protein